MQTLPRTTYQKSRMDFIKPAERLDFKQEDKKKYEILLEDLQLQIQALEKRHENFSKSIKIAARRCI